MNFGANLQSQGLWKWGARDATASPIFTEISMMFAFSSPNISKSKYLRCRIKKIIITPNILYLLASLICDLLG